MKIFSFLYEKMIQWAKHRHANYYLAAVSFAESSFFPIPPDVMLVPMGLARPRNALFYALLTTIFSVLGGIAGYFIGYFAAEWMHPWLIQSSYHYQYAQAVEWFKHWGVWVVIIAGFSPIPYKIFTITAGLLAMPFIPFVLASLLGRGGRFFIVSSIVYFAGQSVEPFIKKYIDWIGWFTVMLLIVAYVMMR